MKRISKRVLSLVLAVLLLVASLPDTLAAKKTSKTTINGYEYHCLSEVIYDSYVCGTSTENMDAYVEVAITEYLYSPNGIVKGDSDSHCTLMHCAIRESGVPYLAYVVSVHKADSSTLDTLTVWGDLG